uniref:Putative secreted protein n=1 Tax=Anopheles darlingi TaxID=43151 RepID=A0A2M4DNC9_ANODA
MVVRGLAGLFFLLLDSGDEECVNSFSLSDLTLTRACPHSLSLSHGLPRRLVCVEETPSNARMPAIASTATATAALGNYLVVGRSEWSNQRDTTRYGRHRSAFGDDSVVCFVVVYPGRREIVRQFRLFVRSFPSFRSPFRREIVCGLCVFVGLSD